MSYNTSASCKLRLLCALSVLFSLITSGEVYAECANAGDEANVVAGSTCDCDYWSSLESHAWLAAEREVVQNQNLIYKADSVLEYTCFDSFLRVTAGNISSEFSDDMSTFGSVPGRSTTSTDKALRDGVYKAFKTWINKNFSHNYLGGRSSQDYSPSSIIGGGSYNCAQLNKVWLLAKCYNFATKSYDEFFTFEEYKSGNDKRRLPTACTKDSRWSAQLDLALLDAKWDIGAQRTFNSTAHSTVTKYLKVGSCQKPQPTGVVIQNELQGTPGDDGFCTNPGCVFKSNKCAK